MPSARRSKRSIRGARGARRLAGALALAACAAAAPAPAQQDPAFGALLDRMDRLEREIETLRGQRPGAAAAGRETRLAETEDQLRRLTDRIERAEFAVRRLGETLALSVRDLEERVAALEAGRGAPPAAQTGPGPAAPAPSTAPPAEPPASAPGPEPAAPAPAGTAEPAETAEAAIPEVAAVDPQTAYDSAYELLKRADYAGAEAALRAFLDRYPDHALAGNASYWLGETHYARREFERAAIAFARGYRAFPDGAKAPDNLLKLGMAFVALGKAEDACLTFSKLRDDHPDAPAMLRDRMTTESARAGCR